MPSEIEELKRKLLDSDEDVARRAAYRLYELGRLALEHALGWTHDPNPTLRGRACWVLGWVVDPSQPVIDAHRPPYLREGVPRLLELLRFDPDPDVRSCAAAALGAQNLPSTLPVLVEAANDPSPQVRFDVAVALGSFNKHDAWKHPEGRRLRPEVRKALLRLMDDEDEDVRDWATFGVHQGDHNTPRARKRLWQALEDPNPDVRGEAANGLAKFGDRTLIPRLEQLLRERAISPCYFEAAEELGDPSLLPVVLEAAERWRSLGPPGEELHPDIKSAIEALRARTPAPRD